MIEFLKVLLYAEFVLLTPQSISFDSTYHLKLDEPVVALGRSAYISINVEDMMTDYQGSDVVETLDVLEKRFPSGSIRVIMISRTGEEVQLRRISRSSGLKILVGISDEVMIGKPYQELIIYTEVPLENVKISWSNISLMGPL